MTRHTSDWINTFVEFTDEQEPAELYRRWAAVGAVSSALGGRCALVEGFITFFPNLYIILIGPPAARKSTALKLALSVVREVREIRLAPAIPGSAQAFLQILYNSQGAAYEPVTHREAECASLAVWSPEIVGFLGDQNRLMISWLTDVFDCPRGPWEYFTKTAGELNIENPVVSILGGATPQAFFKHLPEEARTGGFTSRCIFVYQACKARAQPDLAPGPNFERDHAGLVADLRQIATLQGRFTMSPQFHEAYARWYLDPDEGPQFTSTFLQEYVDRRQVHLKAIAMCLSASRSNDLHLEVRDFDNALELLERTEVFMQGAFIAQDAQHPEHLATANILLALQERKEIDYRLILQSLHKSVTKQNIEASISLLIKMEGIKMAVNSDGVTIIKRGADYENLSIQTTGKTRRRYPPSMGDSSVE